MPPKVIGNKCLHLRAYLGPVDASEMLYRNQQRRQHGQANPAAGKLELEHVETFMRLSTTVMPTAKTSGRMPIQAQRLERTREGLTST